MDNVIIILTGLSASSHVASHSSNPNPGWWEGIVGPDKAIDTNKFYARLYKFSGKLFWFNGSCIYNKLQMNLSDSLFLNYN